MTDEVLLPPESSSDGGFGKEPVGGAPGVHAAVDGGEQAIDGVRAWMRSLLTRQSPIHHGYRYVGSHFVISVDSDLDVVFEFDLDPTPGSLAESGLRTDLTALILIVWCIAARLSSPPNVDPNQEDAAPETERRESQPPPEGGLEATR